MPAIPSLQLHSFDQLTLLASSLAFNVDKTYSNTTSAFWTNLNYPVSSLGAAWILMNLFLFFHLCPGSRSWRSDPLPLLEFFQPNSEAPCGNQARTSDSQGQWEYRGLVIYTPEWPKAALSMSLIRMSKDSELGNPNQAKIPRAGARIHGTQCPSVANMIGITIGTKPTLCT